MLAVLLLRLVIDPVEPDRHDLLKHRLAGYTKVKAGAAGSKISMRFSSGLLLRPEEHEILLGALKKIEAKNATMVAVHAFFMGFLLSALSMPASNERSIIYAIFLLFELLFIIASSVGVRQLDNCNFERAWVKTGLRRAAIPRILQEGLMNDLLVKERLHRFSVLGGLLSVCAAVFFICTVTFCEFESRDTLFPSYFLCLCDWGGIDVDIKDGK